MHFGDIFWRQLNSKPFYIFKINGIRINNDSRFNEHREVVKPRREG